MVTELEKQWAEEEAKEKVKETPAAFIPPEAEAPDMDEVPWPEDDNVAEDMKSAIESHWIGNPLVAGNNTFIPMGIIEVNHKQFIGGVAELNGLSLIDLGSDANFNGGSCIMVFPMSLMEQRYPIREPDPNDPKDMGEWGLRVGIKYIYETLRDVEEMHFQYDSLYMLRANREEDLAVVNHYADMCTMFKSQNSGIAQPNAEEIAMVNNSVKS